MTKIILLIVIICLLIMPNTYVFAQDKDPVTLCIKGITLFFDDRPNEALPYLEAGFAGLENANFPDINDMGLCAVALGLLRDGKSDWSGALEAYAVALDVFSRTGERQFEGVTLNNIGVVYQKQGRYEEALAKFNEQLDIDRELKNRISEGRTLSNIAAIYQSQGRYENALTIFEMALDIARKTDDRESEAVNLNNIAVIYSSQGRYDEALITYEASLAIYRQIDHQAGIGTALSNIAGIFHTQGRYAEAIMTFELSLDIRREIGDRSGEGITLNNIAGVFESQEQYVEALALYEEALVIMRELGNVLGEARALNNIGSIYSSQGQYEEALIQFEATLEIRRDIGDREGEGTTLGNIAGVYHSQGRYEEALALYDEALIIAREVGDALGEAITLNNIALVYYDEGNRLEARNYYEQSIQAIESIRTISGNDIARAGFIAEYSYLYSNVMELYLQDNLFVEAFLINEQGRARSFGDGLATGRVQLTDNENTSLIDAELSSYNAVIIAQDVLAQARTLDPPDPELLADLEVQLEDAETSHDEALAAIAARSDQLAALVLGRRAVLDLPDVQALLDTQSTLVSFWVLEDRTIAFILTDSSFDVIPLDVSEETLNTQVTAFHDFPETASLHPEPAVTLYETLITPIRPILNTPHLIIVPHQSLHYVPFAALTDGQRYLMDDFSITYLPNASMLQFLPDSDETPTFDTALILGNPASDTADEFDNPLTNLPNAALSAQIIAGLFDTTPLIGEAATETVVRDNVSAANILHLGAHGRFNTVAPMQSTLYLTPGDDETDVGDDGRLHVDEVYSLPMDNIQLVVLSACETNLGYLDRDNPLTNISAGDELVSLNRAFLFQSPTVISTLWTVDDAATGLLMEQFYRYLLDGKSKADALRLAQLNVREQYPNPYYWAGFILSGDGGEVDTTLFPELDDTINVGRISGNEATVVSTPSTQTTESLETTFEYSLIIWLIPTAILAIVIGGYTIRRRRMRS